MKQSKLFKQIYKEAKTNPTYWAEGFKIEILEVLYKRMEALKLNQNKLAKLLNVDRTWVSRFFAGKI